jgi:hypothetical protein
MSERLGRLPVTTVGADADGDGKVERLRACGSRSFSIRRADGSPVHDSGNLIERVIAKNVRAFTSARWKVMQRPCRTIFTAPRRRPGRHHP